MYSDYYAKQLYIIFNVILDIDIGVNSKYADNVEQFW